MKKRTTRRALVMSLLSLLLCCSMLVGTTFAWFTDSVTSGRNKIIAGNLDVELYHSDKAVADEKVTEDTLLFDDIELWEPGVVAWENLTVANKGTLALKYQLSVNFDNATETPAGKTLVDVLQVAFVEDGVDSSLTREAMVAGIDDADWREMKTFAQEGMLLPKDTSHIDDANKPADVTDTKTYGVVIYWEPGAADNDYNMNNENQDKTLSIDLGVTLVATQLEAEDDSFGTDYDKEAAYPAIGTAAVDGVNPTDITAAEVTVTIPAGVEKNNYVVKVDSKDETVADNGAVSLNYEINLLKDGVKVQEQTGVSYPVSIQLEYALDIDRVLHNGEEITSYDYDPLTGILTFETNSFSPFSVEFVRMGSDIVVEDGKVTGGTIAGEYEPVDVDETLDDADSEYIAVNYTVDGETRYAIIERANTVVLAAPDTVYTPVYDNYTVKTVAAGKLYAEISALQNNAHSTVYLLPGTYNENTTINVYSSMDIIGLGDAEDIRVVKVGSHSTTSKKPSNRHLFNCNGTKADYIEVTIRNMTLDATEQNSYMGTFFGKEKQMFEDNAAVQSIRKTKVKCYDLTIVKGSNTSAVAFYVNGNNDVDGVKYPAYLYAENCSLDTTKEHGVVTTSATYKFFHTGLTYGGTAYTKNSGSILNKTMEANDWEWD